MSLGSLRYFLVLADELNFRRAARKLYISEQSLSSAVQKLERQYGVPLLERRPRLILTPAGESVARHAREIVRIEEHLTSELADMSEHAAGVLRLGITTTRGKVLLPAIWRVFHERYPNIRLAVSDGSTADLDEMLLRGSIDLYVAVNAPSRNDTRILVFSEENICCVYSDNFLNGASEQQREVLQDSQSGFDLKNLQIFPLIAFAPENGLRITLDDFFMRHGINPHIIFESRSHDLVLNLCRQNTGIGIMYLMVLYDMLEYPEMLRGLHVIPVKNKLQLKYTNLVYRKEGFIPKYMAGFIEVVKDTVEHYAALAGKLLGNH